MATLEINFDETTNQIAGVIHLSCKQPKTAAWLQ